MLIMKITSTRRDHSLKNILSEIKIFWKKKEKEIWKWQKIKIIDITTTRWDDARVWCVEGREGGVEGRHQWISCQKLEYFERNISPKMSIFSEIRNQWISCQKLEYIERNNSPKMYISSEIRRSCHQWEYFETNILPAFNILSEIEIFWKKNYKTMAVMSPWNQSNLLLPKICMKGILLLCTLPSDCYAVCWQVGFNNDTWKFFFSNDWNIDENMNMDIGWK